MLSWLRRLVSVDVYKRQGQGVAQQTKNFADVTRLNSEISDKEKKINQLYQAIGRTYYEQHSDAPAPEHEKEVHEISTLFAEIAQNREEIKQIKGIVKCPSCGADVPLQAAFCSACGAKMESAAPKTAVQGENTKPVSYTHLDVYKRQCVFRQAKRWMIPTVCVLRPGSFTSSRRRRWRACSPTTLRPVSYTHLDVYKRQGLLRARGLLWPVWPGLPRAKG